MDYVGALGIVTVAYVMFSIGTVHKKKSEKPREVHGPDSWSVDP